MTYIVFTEASFENSLSNQVRALQMGKHANPWLQADWTLYGHEQFRAHMLDEGDGITRADVEQHLQRLGTNAYNNKAMLEQTIDDLTIEVIRVVLRMKLIHELPVALISSYVGIPESLAEYICDHPYKYAVLDSQDVNLARPTQVSDE